MLAQVALTGRNDIYASINSCFFGNDVFNRNAALPEATEGGFYEPVGLNKPYISDMVHTASATHNWVAVTSGYDIEHLLSWYCDTDGGRSGAAARVPDLRQAAQGGPAGEPQRGRARPCAVRDGRDPAERHELPSCSHTRARGPYP